LLQPAPSPSLFWAWPKSQTAPSTFVIRRSPSCCCPRQRSCWVCVLEHLDDASTRAPSTASTTSTSTSATKALKGYHLHESPVEAFAPMVPTAGGWSPLFSSLTVRVAAATTAGMLEYRW
jgi:hypothetical protein